MYLSEKDDHLVKKLKTYERRWIYFRWIFLVIGIGIFAGEFSGYSFHLEYAMALSALSVIHAVTNWRGNPYHLLLLRILNKPAAEHETVVVD